VPSAIEYWIDGYNVILGLRLGQGHPLEQRREELVRRGASLRAPCWIVFDSQEGSSHPRSYRASGRVRVQYPPPGTSADDALLDRLHSRRTLASVRVVTDDRELRDRCRFHGAATLSVAEFAALLLPPEAEGPGARDRPLSRAEVEEWLRYFREGDGER
jgi:predicted RNA-binding protein with PIN domain